MKEHTLKIAQLFGCDAQITPSSYSEDFQSFECEYHFKLRKIPTKEELHTMLPTVSDRDVWYLRIISDSDEDLLDLQRNLAIDDAYDVDTIEPFIDDEEVRLILKIEKTKTDGVLTIYDLPQIVIYIQELSAIEFYNALYNNLQEKLVLEIWGEEIETFETSSIAVVKKGDVIPIISRKTGPESRITDSEKYCQRTSKLPALLPEDLHIVARKTRGSLSKLFDQLCLLLSACYIADFCTLERVLLKIRIAGFKTMVSESDKAKVGELAFDNNSMEQWFSIYDWCYTGGYISDRLTISRNIISLNCPNNSTLQINPTTKDAIKSNFKIFEQENVRQYIKVRNDVSKDLLDLQDRVNNVVEGFTGDFRKNVVGLGTFFLTLVIVRIVANGQWAGAFSNQVVALSFVFIALSFVLLIYSRLTLEKKEDLYTKHYKLLRDRYEPLFSKEEADIIFEDGDPNKSGTHSNYIKWQKNSYTWIWGVTLVVFTIFLVVAWFYNLFETTNVYKVIKAILSCCTKNI